MFFTKRYRPIDEYRIVESVQGFYIQQKAYCEQDKKEDWYFVGEYGGIRPKGSFGPVLYAWFGKLSQAKTFVKKLKRGTVYHKC